MAFKNGLSERLDELRFPSPKSPSESPFPTYSSLAAGHPSFVSSFSSRSPPSDVRSNLQRRFTTDSSKLSSWSYLNNHGPTQLPDLELLSSATYLYKSQLFEKKRQHIEYMREQRRRFEEDMKLLDLQHEKEKQEMDKLAQDLAKAGLSGPVSEPTTPPEHRDSGFPGGRSRPARFSTSSVTSPTGMFNVFAPCQVNSASTTPTPSNNRFTVHSVPGSRRNSEEKDAWIQEPAPSFRPGPFLHRYSMPSTGLNPQVRPNIASFNNNASGFDSFSAAKYLFQSEENSSPKDGDRIPTPDIKSYLKMTDPNDKFPTLSRRDDSGLLSANPDALDLANSRTPVPESGGMHSRHRISHQSMPQNTLNMFRVEQPGGGPKNETHTTTAAHPPRHLARHSLGANMFYDSEMNREDMTSAAPSRPVSLHSSYSASDVPTTANANGFASDTNSPKHHTEPFRQRNTSNTNSGRISATNTGNGRQRSTSKDSFESGEAKMISSPPQPKPLQASAASFGPQLTSAAAAASTAANNAGSVPPVGLTGYQTPFYGYGLQTYMGSPTPANTQVQNLSPSGPYSGYGSYGNYRFADSPSRITNSCRSVDGESPQMSRFSIYPLEHYKGDLYFMCKDQHGCRYLQRKLEEQNPDDVQLIFNETHRHVVELMIDPFGNYLCQKLLEYSNNEQRTALINHAAAQLVKIALNQHGTRALQKMIELISTLEQVQTVIDALKDHVVELVQDLNGNHVIQKCLNRLSAEDAQFIFDAVGTNCVVIGTHRHGCCVLQRCIDHASGEQRARLIARITDNAFALVQDPFGNYVVQYILDLAEPHFTEPLCLSFFGNVSALSKQKFSSNVVEKCLRTANNGVRRQMIDEMLRENELEKMLRDSFANYVVQTAMDFADPETRARIVDAIRPILPSIRQTPHGRRIAGKMLSSEGSYGKASAATGSQALPNEMNSSQLPGPLQTSAQKPFLYQQHSYSPSKSDNRYGSQTFGPSSTFGSFSNATTTTTTTPAGGASKASSSTFPSSIQHANGNQKSNSNNNNNNNNNDNNDNNSNHHHHHLGTKGQLYTYY